MTKIYKQSYASLIYTPAGQNEWNADYVINYYMQV